MKKDDSKKERNFNLKDAELITSSLKGLLDSFEDAAELRKKHNAFWNQEKAIHRQSIKDREENKRKETESFFLEICNYVERIPYEQRKMVLDRVDAKLMKEETIAEINKDNHQLEVCRQKKECFGRIVKMKDKLPYNPSVQLQEKYEDRKSRKSIRDDQNREKENSFDLHSSVSYDSIKKAYNELYSKGYVNKETRLKDFRSSLLHTIETKKVDWHEKSTLKYFIQNLVKKDIFENDVSNFWIISRECFTVKGEGFDSNEFRKTTATTSSKKQEELDKVLSFF